MNNLRTGLLILVLLGTILTSARIFQAERERRVLKTDLIELSRIKYGLFSVDEWKAILSDILAKKIQEFDFQAGDREEMRQKITSFLYTVVDDFEANFYEENSNSLGGFFRSSVAGLTGMFKQIRNEVPQFTEQILNFMDDPQNRTAVREYIMSKIDDYAERTFSEIDYTQFNAVIEKYDQEGREPTIERINQFLDDTRACVRPYVLGLLVLVLGTGLYTLMVRNLRRIEYLLITMICLVMLAGGVLLPMIDIDARIAQITFTLLGENVAFEDQVLFYKSKSILEVTQLMVTQGKVDMLAVGLLILCFSVLFPVFKLLASVFYLYVRKLRSTKFVRFLVFKTGKWSMADVMVVAIFMAFIGFRGIVTEQLQQIQNFASNMEIVGTNQSNLQLGFFLFTAFALLSLLVSHRLQYSFRNGSEARIQKETS